MESQEITYHKTKMKRRDEFACATLTGLVSTRSGPLNPVEAERFAKDSWIMADQMLKHSVQKKK